MCILIWCESSRQSSSQRTTLLSLATAMGYTSDSPCAQHTSKSSVLERHGAFGMDTHPTQWVAATFTAGYHYSRQVDGRQPSMGWREDSCNNLLLHTRYDIFHVELNTYCHILPAVNSENQYMWIYFGRFLFVNCIQIDSLWIWMGQTEYW